MGKKEPKTAFVIQPISCRRELYNNDSKHFHHVYEYLFKPSLEALDFTPIFPKTEGSEIIHSDIIKNLETADIVLCDMSTLNPNVFFELGIRTALNKPVCLVTDEKNEKIPFDTTIISYHTYDSQLNAWDLPEEVEKLKNHIQNTFKKRSKSNALWQVFGLKNSGNSIAEIDSESEKLKLEKSLLELKVQQLENEQAFSHPVTPENVYFKKCSSCGFGFEISNRDYLYGISSPTSVHGLRAYTNLGYLSKEQKTEVVTCPKCGNLNPI